MNINYICLKKNISNLFEFILNNNERFERIRRKKIKCRE